ncbi:hypothetical protein A2763_02430 [Candidatus Kaiserbacteria bacterium RIFCSPHIGHO2_01_FULL_54_36]|uniref:HTH deoR-type domain-containing protein n=1 Tax=Candidatus Kaiserbacteria bacterium RIFCSPHIGHO2_01_FULL_54_36 TaxID=1798482 RepID=A0A1F6CNP8_9BACT|nr:MAG: hypothetical protein A2763_02430 [Candidatus Kaiserbacteria bacterium RIFCSPHIGHO2_01_FULL_54_36]OGG76016.1 MAG: hypothetical protein A3A41_03535 [Candidatus Kaiserbacteria bacterium RIFCSPLOWO2_01_FULL_54_22]
MADDDTSQPAATPPSPEATEGQGASEPATPSQEAPAEPAEQPIDDAQGKTAQPEVGTAHRPVDEPLSIQTEPFTPPQEPPTTPPTSASTPAITRNRELLMKGHAKTQERKQKKLDRIMAMFEEKKQDGSTSSPQVTNNDVEKLLHVSDATATRYLSILVKEGRVRRVGKTGAGVVYTKA